MEIIRIVNKSKNPLPKYETAFSSGMDLRASLENEEPITIKPFERVLVKTDLFIELPEGHEATVRPRSGLAINHGITVLNAPGTVDQDFVGNISIILINLSNKDFVVNQGDRIAQMVISKVERVKLENVLVLSETARGEKGFGSTKIK